MYTPSPGTRVKLRELRHYYTMFGVTPNWQWLRVIAVVDSEQVYGVPDCGTFVDLELLDGDKPTGNINRIPLGMLDPPIGYREPTPEDPYVAMIPPGRVEEVRSWFKDRGGVIRRVNCEIGASRPEQLQPAETDGEPTGPPHWAYVGEALPVKPEWIGVRTVTPVPMPLDWFPKCDRCNGTGKITVASLAKVRKETVADTLKALKEDQRATLIDDKTIRCWCCDGTGRKERHVRVAIRRKYWGMTISEGGKKKAVRLAKKLGKDVKYDWQYIGYGLAELRFYREEIVPFTLEETANV